MSINDLSHLDPEEASQRVLHLAYKIWYEQFKANWFIKDVRSDVYLRNEIRAFLEGRIQEIHGFTDIPGQMSEAVVKPLQDFFQEFWENTISPGIEAILQGFQGIWEDAKDYALNAYNEILNVVENVSDIYTYLTETISQYLQNAIELVENLPDTVEKFIADAVSSVEDYVLARVNELNSTFSDIFTSIQQTLVSEWNSLVENVSGSFEAIMKGVEALPQTVASGFQSAISYVWELILSARKKVEDVAFLINRNVVEPVWKGLTWVFEWIRDQALNFINYLYNVVAQKIEALKRGDIVAGIELLGTPILIGAGVAGLISVLGTKIVGTGIEVGEIGSYLNRVMSPEIFTGALMGTLIGTGVTEPLKQIFRKQFRTSIPTIAEATKMYWRGILNESELQEIVARWGFGGKYAEGFMAFTENIPGASDLVRFVVRECFPLEELPAAPSEFVKYMAMHGFNELWCRAYWEAHWELPAFGQLVEAYHRGIISLEELKRYIVWHDYKPVPRPGVSKSDVEILSELIYKLPGKLDARWMLRWGIIGREEFKKLIRSEGYHPDWLEKVYEGEYMNMLLDERTAVKTAIQSLYIMGAVNEEVLRSVLREVRFLDDEINYLLQSSKYRLRREELEDAISALRTAFRNDKITVEEFAAKLADLGLTDDRVQRILAIEQARMKNVVKETGEEQVKASGYSVVIKRFKEGVISEVELEQELKMLGYTDARIKQLKIIGFLERDYDYAMTVLSAVKSAYLKNKIGDATFIETLRKFGFTDEKILLELNLLKLRRGYEIMGKVS